MKKIGLIILTVFAVMMILPAVHGADYEYCTYKTVDCNKIRVDNTLIYDCDAGECIGVIEKGDYVTIECIEPAPSADPFADVFIHSYSPLCDAKCGIHNEGEKWCSGNNVMTCEVNWATCTATEKVSMTCDPNQQSTCQTVSPTDAKCDCASNECPYEGYTECSSSSAEKVCKRNTAGCTYWAYNEPGAICGQGEVCKEPAGTAGSCKCDNKCSSDICIQDNTYKECMSYTTTGCTYLSSEKWCASGQECIGAGACQCPQPTCQEGTSACGDGINTYKECKVWSGTCPSFGTDKLCPTASSGVLQVCNPDTGTCQCPQAEAPENSRRCIGPDGATNQYQVYKKQGNDLCPSWGTAQTCDNPSEVCNDGVCGCPSTGIDLYEKQCLSAYQYQQWAIKPGQKCPSWSDAIYCPTSYGSEYQTCNAATNECQCPPTSYIPEVSKKCLGSVVQIWRYKQGDNCPSWQPVIDCSVTGEECGSGACGCPDTGINVGDKKCFDTWSYQEYDYQSQTCPTWGTKISCPGDQMCYESETNKAQCIDIYQDVTIIADSAYAIEEKIEGIKVIVSKAVGTEDGIYVKARLLEDGIELPNSRLETYTVKGEAELNFNYAHPRAPATIVLEVTVGTDYQEYKATKDIKIQSALKVYLSSNPPFAGVVGRDITVTWDVEDKKTGMPVSVPAPQVKITQGDEPIYGTPIGNTGIKFSTLDIGWVNVEVSVAKEGYISDTETLDIEIKDLDWTVDFEIDDKPFSYYTGSGVTTGTHKLVLKVWESGEPIDVQQIDATIRTPSGENKAVFFTKVSTGIYKHTSFDFAQPGHTYDFEAIVTLKDISADGPPPFRAKIATLDTPIDDKNLTTYFIVGGSVAAVLLLIVMILIFGRKRK